LCKSWKAKYYPNCSLLHAGPKKGSSYTWQSIVAGLKTFKRGHVWRIGIGEKVNIWEDHWIPTSPMRKVITRRGQVLYKTVDQLIDPTTNLWDEELVRMLFLHIDAERILRIPLSSQLDDDFVAWHHTKNYIFSVKSAYYIEWDHQFGSQVRRRDGQGSSQDNPVWEKVWSLEVPSKVKIFIWKALHGVVPGMAILASRHIKVQPQCPICMLGPEDIKHLLFCCGRARQVWGELGLLAVIEHAILVDRSGSVVLEHILCSPNSKVSWLENVKTHELLAVGCWYIWWQRRELVKDENVSPPKSSAFAINALAANFGAVKHTAVEREVKWSKPPRGHQKLNVDASYHANGSGSAGIVLRNDKGSHSW
jgi:hypothetical protein